jgi:hypothetical protein
MKKEKKPRLSGAFFLPSARRYRPPGAGARVEPLGEGLINVFPDGFRPLFAPAAELPALLDMPEAPELVPAALPDVVPVAVPLAAAPPVVELPLAEPPLDCANAEAPVKASAVASPNVASFMVAPCCCCILANEVRQYCVPAG